MGYAAKSDMILRHGEEILIELSDHSGLGTVNDTVLNQALADAEALIDGYVAQRYRLPMSPVPEILKKHACSIAFYNLHRGRYTDEVRKEYEDVLTFLRGVARGEVSLPAAGHESASAPAEARVEGPDRIFNRDSLKVF